MIYNLYIFDRHATCLYYQEWNRKKKTKNLQEEAKLMFGLCLTLKQLSQRISPKAPNETSFRFFKTNTYKLHYFESLSGLKIIMNTDPGVGDLREVLQFLYANIFVEYVTKNPLASPDEPVECELFVANLNKYIQSIGA